MSERGHNVPNVRNPAITATAVTPHDSNTIDLTRALYIGTAGALKVRMADGSDCVFGNVGVGLLPIQADMVYDTGTDAEDIVALR